MTAAFSRNLGGARVPDAGCGMMNAGRIACVASAAFLIAATWSRASAEAGILAGPYVQAPAPDAVTVI